MTRLREISDWDFSEEMILGPPVLLIGFASRLDRRHRRFIERLRNLAVSFDAGVAFRLADVAENPSLVRRAALTKFPALLIYSLGAEHSRWEGEVDLEEVVRVLDEMVRARGAE